MDRQLKPRPVRMRRRRRLAMALALMTGMTAGMSTMGCRLAQVIPDSPHDTKTSYHDHSAMQIEYPDVARCVTPSSSAAQLAQSPHALTDPAKLPAIEMTLPEAVQRALQFSPVLRNLGGTVVSSPQLTETVFGPALAHANPQTGVEAALAAFDAQYTQSLSWDTVDQPQNVEQGGLGAAFNPRVVQGTTGTFANALSKRTATGTEYTLRNNVVYDNNNRPFREFTSDFVGFMEAEVRHPLMRGAGTQYNRIVGSAASTGAVGQYNGVLIARVNEDVALADFEAAVIGLVEDVEEAYWNLQTAYRVLEATAKGREAALQTFQYQQVRLEVGTGRQDEEAQARSQYYSFESQVQSALAGSTGLYALEQNLRYLIGMPATDGSIIKPITAPLDAKVVFDWQSSLGQALTRRVEVRRQSFNVRRRELELYAARLNHRPQMDFVGQYRWRGLGDHLIGGNNNGVNDNLFDDITDGNYQEWSAAMEISLPVGLRAAAAAIAHAKLNLRRERAILSETEMAISHSLSDAARAVELNFKLVETNYNQYRSDLRQVEVLRSRYRDGTDNINFLLQAQRQVVTSESSFYQSITNYNLAIRDFHREKGSLLAYNQVSLTEGPWCPGAQQDAVELGRFLQPRCQPEKVCVPRPVSRGPFDPSEIQPSAGMMATPMMEPSAPVGMDKLVPIEEGSLEPVLDSMLE